MRTADDIILNESGAILFYSLLKFSFLDAFIRDFFYKEKKMCKNEIKKTMILGVSLFVILISIILYINKQFQINRYEYEKIKRPKFQFNYPDEC